MAIPPRKVHQRRATITALPLYHSGHLLKKHAGEKDFKMFYGELRGAVLFLYENDTQDTYTERLDLDQLKSMKLDPFQKTPAIFKLNTCNKEIQLKMDNQEVCEEWRGYILTVVKREIPSSLDLLPGKMLGLMDALAQEKKRVASAGPNPPLPPRPSFLTPPSGSPPTTAPPQNKAEPTNSQAMPSCFFSVSRQEAEQMLEKNPEFGNIILRPSTRTNSYGLTLRQPSAGGPVLKNYRVTSTNSGFIIELDTPVKVPSLNDVITYVLQKTEHRLQPYSPSQAYDTRLETPLPPKPTTFTSTATKPVPKAKVQPFIKKPQDQPPPTPVKPEDSEYLVPEDEQCPLQKNSGKKTTDQPDHFDGELRKALKHRRECIYSNDDNPYYASNP